MKNFIIKYKLPIIGALSGIANGLFGAGGGIICVFLLRLCGMEQKRAQAASLSVTVFLSATSAIVYFINGSIDISSAIKFIPFGLFGAFLGAKLLKSASPRILKLSLAAVMIFSGVRLVIA